MRKFLISALFIGALALVVSPASHATPVYSAPHSNFSRFTLNSTNQFGSGDAGQVNHFAIFNLDTVNYCDTYVPTSPTPEPSSLLLLGTGLLGVGAWFRHKLVA